ncbi:hypothetical protein KDH_75010 [Dictyobacter sp. S3.2.2.5]|uniref:CBM11 domain-containing protein n=1 Tax=Dictyobacter halimunensis TaxID=3026934 RepID=A0ABQ6G3K5_9CHLR|nr:hypothetical protein KDH_75010 [Dictyobacter sp. S3.2.2.5]
MNTQNRIYVTLSPRLRKALDLCALLDGSSSASYAAGLLSNAIMREIERNPALRQRWTEMEQEALLKGGWDSASSGQQGQARKSEAAPGWLLSGDHAESYESGVEEQGDGKNSGYLRSKETWSEGFGTLMQSFTAGEYCGKRLRYSALVRTEDVEDWAGLWLRADGPQQRMLAFDNMQKRPITGTIDWRRYDIVLDVPQECSKLAFGILLQGPGQVWISDIQFTIVEADTPPTSPPPSNQPTNLDFAH